MMVGLVAGHHGRSQLVLSAWSTTNNQFPFTHKLLYQLEASFRSDTKRQDLQTFLLRTGVFALNDFNKGSYVLLQNEFFFNVSGQQYVNGKWFDQNRSLVGTGYRFNRHTDVELSYMLRLIKDAG